MLHAAIAFQYLLTDLTKQKRKRDSIIVYLRSENGQTAFHTTKSCFPAADIQPEYAGGFCLCRWCGHEV